MTFASPYLLVGLVAIPLAIAGYLVLERRRARRSAPWARRPMLPNAVRRPPRRLAHVPAALYLVGLALLLVGFARPQRVLGTITPQPPTVVVAMDVSGSMAATDVRPTRLLAARHTAIRFLRALPAQYRVALVTFGNVVRVEVPPTRSRDAVIARLPRTITPRAGTAIGDAVSRSVAVIVDAAGGAGSGLRRPGAILVLSDGRQNAGGTTVANAAVTALVDYIPVDTVAVGTRSGSVTQSIKLNDLVSTVQLQVPVRPATLRAISSQTGGRSFDEQTPASALVRPFVGLQQTSARTHRTQELSAAAGGVALVAMLAGFVVSGAWFGRRVA
jgi:Ca-activated chloride channel family protein